MNHAETKPRDEELASYVQSMESLRSEMAIAMDCITASALIPLQESIARQEVLCAELAVLAKSCKSRVPPHPSRSNGEGALASQVRATSALLCQTNLEYAALLKHSGRTLSLLSSLCRTHTGQFQEARGPRSKYQTWSCEM